MILPEQTSVQFLKGVGPARVKLFANLGVRTIEDLLYFFPRRYEDRRKCIALSHLVPGETVVTSGCVTAKGGRKTAHRNKHIFELVLRDEGAKLFCIWYNQPYLENIFQPGVQVVLFGRVLLFNNRLQMVCPEYEILDAHDPGLGMNRIVPVYSLTRGLSQKYIRRTMMACLDSFADQLPDFIPKEIVARQKLAPIAASLRRIHFPENENDQEQSLKRVSFDEFFLFQISVLLRRSHAASKKGFVHRLGNEFKRRFLKALPFPLTGAQEKVIEEISRDMGLTRPMLRLLQGDVGSGKTVVAFWGCLAAIINGHQAAFMAPTEIVAEQHFQTFTRFFKDGPFGDIRIGLLTGFLKKKEKLTLIAAISAGEIDVVFGTHALLEEGVTFNKLTFVAIDEQHKFGVEQRALLSEKGGDPDVLVMTATPIPRSLCLTLYGDLDVSTLENKPEGRGTIKTYHFTDAHAEAVYARVVEWVAKGSQAYIVYPIIEASEVKDLKSAELMFARFQKGEFKNFRLGLIHGRMPRQDMKNVMSQFKAGKIDILVTTTVLEVGVDVPNANVMVIEHAAHFGLSQLHQLRGRIGRSEKNAVCVLLGDAVSEEGHARLETIVAESDGFLIAKKDLEIRGPGQYFGRHQHGLSEIRVTDPLSQLAVLESAREEAVLFLKSDPALKNNQLIKSIIRKRYPDYLERVWAG